MKYLFLILLYLITFAWDDFENDPTFISGYKLYISRVTCTEPQLEETIIIHDKTAREFTFTGCGTRPGNYSAFATTLGIVPFVESEPSNIVQFQFQR